MQLFGAERNPQASTESWRLRLCLGGVVVEDFRAGAEDLRKGLQGGLAFLKTPFRIMVQVPLFMILDRKITHDVLRTVVGDDMPLKRGSDWTA